MSERRRYSMDKSSPGVAPIFEHFHTFKEFMQLQADSLEPGVAVGLYDQYKYDYKVFSSRKMFVQSQERRSGFVLDRYAPAHLQQLCRRKTRHARTAAQLFLTSMPSPDYSLPAGTPPGLALCQHPSGRVIGTLKQSAADFKEELSAPRDPACTLVLKKLPGDVTLKMLEDLCVSSTDAGQTLPGFLSATLVPSCLTEEHRSALMLQASKDVQDCTEQEQSDIQHALSECYIRAKGGALYPLLTGWLEFDSEENCSAAEILLDQKAIGDITTARAQKLRTEKPRSVNVVSAASEERLALELGLAKKLIQRLDDEFHVYNATYDEQAALKQDDAGKDEDDKADEKSEDGMTDGTGLKSEAALRSAGNPSDSPQNDNNLFLASLSTSLSTSKALDVCISYLRAVHLTDFYCGRMCWTVRELVETCGIGTLRLTSGVDMEESAPETDSLVMSVDDGNEFEKRVDELMSVPYDYIQLDINENHPLFQTHWVEFAGINTIRVDDEKFRCGICKKLFKGPDFVHKHIKNKHQEEIVILLKNVSHQLMNQVFEADEAKLLLFIANSTDYMRVFPNKSSTYYGPQRRTTSKQSMSGGGSGGRSSGQAERSSPMFRDWDAPRTRLEDKSAGGNFRRAVRYDDL